MSLSFGTDGVRGVANTDLSPEFALKLGRAVAFALGEAESDGPILVARDTRCSGALLEGAFVAGVLSTGRNVITVGIVPTPALALITKSTHSLAGVMISASHNPIQDNGFKVFDRNGMKLADAIEATIEHAIHNDRAPRPTHAEVGSLEHAPQLLDVYLQSLIDDVPRLDGMTVVVDGAYGAAWDIAPRALSALGATVIPLHCENDGTQINVQCGATDLGRLEKAVLEASRDGASVIGVAFDGDADRVRFVDEEGQSVEGDAVILMMARDLHQRGVLSGATVVGTVMSNLACERELEKSGIRLLRTPVGDRYVLERLRQEGAIFGGEPSGHLIDLRRNATGDGPATAIAVLGLLKRTKQRLHDIASAYTPYPQELINVHVRSQIGIVDHPRVTSASAAAVKRLGNSGRLLIRSSGTEPLVRVMVEGEDAHLVHEIASSLAQTVRDAANV